MQRAVQTFLQTLPPEQPVLIAGPTASGKSALAAQIVAAQGGVIVNADALQIYDCWRLLSARPSVAEEAAHPHRLYGHVGRHQPYSVGHWLRDITPILQSATEGGPRPVIVGGTGLYFTALTTGLAEIPAIPAEIRAAADLRLQQEGAEVLLRELDPETASRIDQQNPARIQRAWEVLAATGRGLAAWQKDTPAPLLPPARARLITLTPDRDWLAERIDRRFEQMMEQGALDEVRAALPDWDPMLPSSRPIGAPELIAALRGECSIAEAVEAAQLATRQYAKRQRTWFRNRLKGWDALILP